MIIDSKISRVKTRLIHFSLKQPCRDRHCTNVDCREVVGRVILITMRRVFHIFLLIGALIGLLGQEVAFATVAPITSAPVKVAASPAAGMPADCMKMMAQQQQPARKHCNGMSLACMAAMGCLAPMAIQINAPILPLAQINPVLAFWPITPVMQGNNLAPDPEPPTVLG